MKDYIKLISRKANIFTDISYNKDIKLINKLYWWWFTNAWPSKYPRK